MKKTLFFLTLAVLIIFPAFVRADSQTNYQQNVIVPATEKIEDNFVRFGNNVTVDGAINGDVITAGMNITINGAVAGDVLAIGQNVKINGPVAGNVRVAGSVVEINNTVGKNVNIAAQTATLTDKAVVGWSLSFAASSITVNSTVGGSIYGYANQVNINNSVGSNVTLFMGDQGQATLLPKTAINGNFTYTGTQPASSQSGATIKGDTVHKLLPADVAKSKKFLAASWVYLQLIGLFGLLLAGTIIISLLKNLTERITDKMRAEPAKTIMFGIIYLIVTPIALLIVALTIIGVPVALIGAALYLMLVYLSKIFIGTLLGKWLLGYFRAKDTPQKTELPLIWPMLLGTAIVFIVSVIPYLGFLIGLISSIWFLGAVGEIIKAKKTN